MYAWASVRGACPGAGSVMDLKNISLNLFCRRSLAFISVLVAGCAFCLEGSFDGVVLLLDLRPIFFTALNLLLNVGAWLPCEIYPALFP